MDAKKVNEISKWIERIEKSALPISTLFDTHDIPFSRAQFFIYKRRLKESGPSGLIDKRCMGGNRKITLDQEAFLKGCIKRDSDVSLGWLQRALMEEFNCKISLSAVSRALTRIAPERVFKVGGRPKAKKQSIEQNAMGGFELIIAVAYHLGWPQRTADVILESIDALKRSDLFVSSGSDVDKKGRNKSGNFTGRYNKRRDVRASRFASISDKRQTKNWHSMNIIKDHHETITRKNLAILSLPILTGNGQVRNVNLAQGQALEHLCGFNYKQSSITK